MARRRKARRRSVRRAVSSAPKRRRSRSNTSRGSVMNTVLGSMAYGAIRQKTSDLLTPITAKVPFGNLADEVVIAGLAYYGRNKIKNPMAKSVLNSALIVESARIGEALAMGSFNGSSSSPAVGKIF